MKKLTHLITLVAVLLVVTACGSPAIKDGAPEQPEGTPAASSSVTGTVTYRERIALPENAVVTVQLRDVSKADAPAEILSEQVIQTAGKQVPFPFELKYDPKAIVENHTYTVFANIKSGDTLLFISDTAYPVITRGNPNHADLILVKTG